MIRYRLVEQLERNEVCTAHEVLGVVAEATLHTQIGHPLAIRIPKRTSDKDNIIPNCIQLDTFARHSHLASLYDVSNWTQRVQWVVQKFRTVVSWGSTSQLSHQGQPRWCQPQHPRIRHPHNRNTTHHCLVNTTWRTVATSTSGLNLLASDILELQGFHQRCHPFRDRRPVNSTLWRRPTKSTYLFVFV